MDNDTSPGIIVGTAGHVDHGKTELIKALTGVDTDRLAEEKRRGLTIDLGFAPLNLPASGRVGMVDVPGHHRFLKNMLAGVGGIDVALLVVAADEGIMPQTREHFDILRLLGVSNLLAVVTKVDAVEPDLVELVAEEVADLLSGTPLENSIILKVSSTSGAGLDELVRQLDEMVATLPRRQAGPYPRLPVDRIFILKGIGTVITGSLTHGTISQGQEVMIFPGRAVARVRHIHVHNRQEAKVVAGHRVALNLAGVSKEQLNRGDIISTADAFEVTHRLDVKLIMTGTDRVVKDWTRVRVYHGSAELLARLVILSAKEIRSGQEAFCQLRLETPTVAWMGDRFVLRGYSPPQLLGGGVVLSSLPPKHKRFDPVVLQGLQAREGGDPEEILLTALAQGPLVLEDLARGLGPAQEQVREAARRLREARKIEALASYLILREDISRIEERAVFLVGDFHRRHPLKGGLSKEELKGRLEVPGSLVEEILSSSTQLEVEGDLVRQRGQHIRFTPQQEQIKERIESVFLKAALSPPTKDEVSQEFDLTVFYAMVKQGILVALTNDIYIHRQVLRGAKDLIGKELARRGAMRLSEMKDIWGTSRKYAVPLAEYLDNIGFTQRVGDRRELVSKPSPR